MKIKSLLSTRNTALLGGFVFIIIVGVTIFGGAIGGKQDKALSKQSSKSLPEGVNTAKSVLSIAEDRVLSLKVSGLTEPSQVLDIESQLSGTIKKIFVKEGSTVKKGAPLMKMSAEDRLQKLESAKALLKLREMQYAAAKRLSEKNFTSPISLADTERNLSDAKLSLSQARLELDYLTIKAPFASIVNRIHVEEGSVISNMSVERKICTLVNLNPLYLTVYVTEKIYDQLQLGSIVTIQLADGRALEGKIDSFSVVADPQTRTFQVRIVVPNLQHLVPAGMTGVVEIPMKEQRTHKLHPSWVTLSKEGSMGVMAVEKGRAVFYPVTVVDSSPSFLYVSGLPDQLEIITLGQESVAIGVRVHAQLEPNQDRK